jgi:hypothetical protein
LKKKKVVLLTRKVSKASYPNSKYFKVVFKKFLPLSIIFGRNFSQGLYAPIPFFFEIENISYKDYIFTLYEFAVPLKKKLQNDLLIRVILGYHTAF